MTDDEFAAMAEDESRAASRRAAHLVWLLAVDEDGPGFQREIHKLAIGDDADPLFVAQVAAVCAQIAELVFRAAAIGMENRRTFLGGLIAANPPDDVRDLEPPPDPS